MKVYLTSCETGDGAWRRHERVLGALGANGSRAHALVADPAAADLIIVGNIRREHAYRSLRHHSLIRRFPAKCFGMSEDWLLVPLLRGLYVNAHRGLPFPERFRTGCYALYHPDFKNPLVEAYPDQAFLKPKRYLASFCGRRCVPVRDALFAQKWKRGDIRVEDTSDFNAFTHVPGGKTSRHEDYCRTMEASKFALCPRGTGAARIRLFEAMRMGVAPVILSDAWLYPRGPDWDECAIRVPEAEVGHLEEILLAREHEFARIGRCAQEVFRKFFADEVYFDFVVEQMVSIAREQRIPETLFWRLRHVRAAVLSLPRHLGPGWTAPTAAQCLRGSRSA